VCAFLDGYPTNGYRYQVKVSKGCNVAMVLQSHTVPELVEACKKDIQQRNWEKLSEHIRENRFP
jgi:hypothetical protein